MKTITVRAIDPIDPKKHSRPNVVFVGAAVRVPARVAGEFHVATVRAQAGDRSALAIATARLDEYQLADDEVLAYITGKAAALGLWPAPGTMESISYIEADTGDCVRLVRLPFRERPADKPKKPADPAPAV